MTLNEWIETEALIAAEWPQARLMDRRQAELRHRIVADLAAEHVNEMVVALAREGREWPPSPGQLFARIAERQRPASPSPGEVLQLLTVAAGTFGRDREAGALRWLASRSPHAARFAVEHGWRAWCGERLDDPEFGGAVRQRIERSIASATAGLDREHQRGEVRALVGTRLRHLELGTGEQRGLRQLDTGSVLPPPPPQLTTGERGDAA